MIGKIRTALAVAAMCFALPAGAGAAEAVTIKTVPVAEQISMLTGEGGNIGLFIGADGTFLIDDQFAPMTDKILAAIKAAGGDVPKFLINTHYHADHTGGNENLGRNGTLIFSHDNVRAPLVSGSYLEAFGRHTPATAPAGLPVVTFGTDLTFHLNGDTVHAIHIPGAHTDGDSIIHFEAANVIHAGDIFFNGFYPFIDVGHGGSLKGMIKAVDRILALADDRTKIIPGHGPLADKEELANYRQMLDSSYNRLKKLRLEGKTVREAIAANPLADMEGIWGDGLFTGDRWIELVYPGVY
jgi:glyoxylase-like metal-dependent hydrolase (beta-lactamase superfamily II)